MPRWAMFVVGLYVVIGLATFGFQTEVRLSQCAGAACGISLAKGFVWSVIWPIYWPVYLAGWKP